MTPSRKGSLPHSTPSAVRVWNRPFSRLFLYGLMAICLMPAVPLSSHADGLHARILDGDDVEKAWRKLVWRTWPGYLKAPTVSLHQKRPAIIQAIHELIAIVQFVDPYNFADDSPAWMATEESRGLAREQAHKILVELGRGAAPYVWEALSLETRFKEATEIPDKLVPPYRKAQIEYKSIIEQVEGERRQDEEYAQISSEFEKVRPKVNILKYLDSAERELRIEKVAARTKPELLKKVEDELKEVGDKKAKLGDLLQLQEQLEDLRKKKRERALELDQGENLVELIAKMNQAKKSLDEHARSSANLGQGLDPEQIGGDPTMVTYELYENELTSVLVDMGPEALPDVVAGKRIRRLSKVAEQIEQQWLAGRWAPIFAQVAYSERTKVGMAAEIFLKSRFNKDAIQPIIEVLPKTPAAERPALYKALRELSGQDLPDEVDAWTRVIEKGTGDAKKGIKQVDRDADEDE